MVTIALNKRELKIIKHAIIDHKVKLRKIAKFFEKDEYDQNLFKLLKKVNKYIERL